MSQLGSGDAPRVPGLSPEADTRQLLDRLWGEGSDSWLSPATAGDAAAELIRAAIFDGALRPGDQIPVEEIMEVLGVSRLPVREAMNSLKHEGLVRVEPYRGSFVGPFDRAILVEHWEILGMLHGHSAARVARHRDPAANAQLRGMAADLAAVSTVAEASRLEFEFRRAVNRAGGTERLRSIMRPLGRFVPAVVIHRLPNLVTMAREGSMSVVEAIESGDPRGAERASRQWTQVEGDSVIASLERAGVFIDP